MAEIKGYQIIKKLGAGGMAVVYLAKEEGLDREVALKVLTVHTADETFNNSFLAEARLVAKLDHPDIIKIYRVDVEEDDFYMEMEFLSGGTLKERLAKETLTMPTILSIIKQMASALSYAHQQGCIHRDIKPANILFKDNDDDVVLADFGIAKLEGIDSDLTIAGHSGVGTLNYMSPEQAMGGDVDGRTDTYSLGVVFYEMLTGEKPFKATHISALIHQQTTADVPCLPTEYAYFQAVLDRVLAQDKNERYDDAFEFYTALVEAYEQHTGELVEDGTIVSLPPHIRKKAQEQKAKKAFYTKISIIVALLIVLPLALVGAYVWWQSEQPIKNFPELTPTMQSVNGGALTLKKQCVADDKACMVANKNYTLEIKDFLISQTEVTFAQWDTCVAQKGCSHQPDDEGWGRDQRPVINVSWHDIQEYMAWLNKKTGLVYQLPTEAQWLYAAQAKRETLYPWGNTIINNKANCDGCQSEWDNKSTAPVASFASYEGLYDMYGNVGEWTCSVYKSSTAVVDNKQCGSDGSAKDVATRYILRGGSWQDEPEYMHSARGALTATKRYKTFGFRLVRMP